MKAKELRAMNEPELESKIVEIRKELMKANSQIAIGTIPKSPGKVKDMKRAIAMIMTIRREKENNARKKQAGGSKKE